MKLNIIFTLIVTLCLLLFLSMEVKAIELQNSKVHGTVVDTSGAVISKVQVIIENDQEKKSTFTNEHGEYEFDISPDVYQISAKGLGWLPFKRAPFHVEQNASILINMVLIFSSLDADCIIPNVGNKGLQYLSYDSFFSAKFGIAKELLVRFTEKKTIRGYYIYTYPHTQVLVTYDNISIYADEISFNDKTLVLKAQGNVILENGNKRTTSKTLTLNLNEGVVIEGILIY